MLTESLLAGVFIALLIPFILQLNSKISNLEKQIYEIKGKLEILINNNCKKKK